MFVENAMIVIMIFTLGEDISLVHITGVPLHYNPFSANIVARKLIQASKFYVGYKILVDCCHIGTITCPLLDGGLGRKARGPRFQTDNEYVIPERGIYATNPPYIPHPPKMLLGIFGTRIIRIESTFAHPGGI
jgi:hypothetical protein